MKDYEFLLFDADYTLLDFDADMEQAFRAAYHEADFHKVHSYSPEMLASYSEINNQWWKKFEAGECTKQALYENRFAEFQQLHNFPGNSREISNIYFKNLSKFGSFLEGARLMLERLSQNHKIYIVTNGNAASQAERIQSCGLSAYIEDCFVSEEVGVGKPDKRYFDYVFSHIPGFDPAKAIVIGDSLSSDIQGACNAGLDSIWYNPGRLPNPKWIPYTFEAESHAQILKLLEQI